MHFILLSAHPRRIAALKTLTYAPINEDDLLNKLYEIVFGILDKVCHNYILNWLYAPQLCNLGSVRVAWFARQVSDAGKVKRKKGMFGRETVDKEVCVLIQAFNDFQL